MKTLRVIGRSVGWLFVAANVCVATIPPYTITNLIALGVAFVLTDSLRSTR